MDCNASLVAGRAAVLLVFSALVAACGSSSINLDAPTAVKCQVSATSSVPAAPASGGSGTVDVSTTRDCAWSATSSTSWIAITSPTSGQGTGSIEFRVAPNPDHAARKGTLAVNDASVTVNQDAAPCTYSVAPANSTVDPTGGVVRLTVSTLSGCQWSAVSTAPWLRVDGSGSASGSATVTVATNTGAERTGTVTIADRTATIVQSAVAVPPSQTPAPVPTPAPAPTPSPTPIPTPPPDACRFAIAPSSYLADAGGDATTVAVTTTDACSWSASSGADWIAIVSGGSGTGNGNVSLRIAPNPGPSRTAVVTIAGGTFSVSQAAAPPCTYAISPKAGSFTSSGGTGLIVVLTGSACRWTAVSNDDWITIGDGAAGTGTGTVTFAVAAAKHDKSRKGTITVARQTFTVTQSND